MARSGWAATLVALVLVAAFGNEPVQDTAFDADRSLQPLMSSLTTFPAWGQLTDGAGGDVVASIVVRVVVLLVVAFGLAMLAGGTSSAAAAFLAGWGAFVVATAVAGAAFYAAVELLVFQGDLADREGGFISPLVREVNAGASFALYTGALVGAAVALTRRTTMKAFAGVEPALPIGTQPATGPRPVPVVTPAGSPGATAPPPVPGARSGSPPVPGPTWPPPPAVGAVPPPSPAWTPPRLQLPLPAAPLPRRGVGSRPVPTLPGDPAATAGLDAPPVVASKPEPEPEPETEPEPATETEEPRPSPG